MLIVLLVAVAVLLMVLVVAVGMGRAGAASDRQADEAVLEYQRQRAELREQLKAHSRDEHIA